MACFIKRGGGGEKVKNYLVANQIFCGGLATISVSNPRPSNLGIQDVTIGRVNSVLARMYVLSTEEFVVIHKCTNRILL